MKPIKCEWTPRVGVGVLRVGTPVKEYVSNGYLKPERHDPPFDQFETYEDAAGLLSVDLDEEGLIESILCDETLQYDGYELIGRSVDEIRNLLGAPEEVGEVEAMFDDRKQTPWLYDRLGLTISFEDGVSVSATVGEPDLE